MAIERLITKTVISLANKNNKIIKHNNLYFLMHSQNITKFKYIQ